MSEIFMLLFSFIASILLFAICFSITRNRADKQFRKREDGGFFIKEPEEFLSWINDPKAEIPLEFPFELASYGPCRTYQHYEVATGGIRTRDDYLLITAQYVGGVNIPWRQWPQALKGLIGWPHVVCGRIWNFFRSRIFGRPQVVVSSLKQKLENKNGLIIWPSNGSGRGTCAMCGRDQAPVMSMEKAEEVLYDRDVIEEYLDSQFGHDHELMPLLQRGEPALKNYGSFMKNL